MLSTTFVSDLKLESSQRNSEIITLSDLLSVADVQIDRYDEIINNMDKAILPLIEEINVAISSVKTAYDNLVNIGCKNDLIWQQTSEGEFVSYLNGERESYTATTYTAVKSPSLQLNYNYFGAKYYRRPQNQDYGSNIVEEFIGSLGSGSNNLAVISIGVTQNMQLNDLIIDDIDNPLIFPVSNLPKIIGFGVSSIQTEIVDFGGIISFGSTVIAHTGIGTTLGIQVGSSIELDNVLMPGTSIVGFGTTALILTQWNSFSGSFISTSFFVNSLIINQSSIGIVTNGIFKIGIMTQVPSILISTTTIYKVPDTNFTVIRNTQSVNTVFDYTNNPIDPVTIGIMNSNSIGYGHDLVLVNNGANIGPFQWHEVRGEFSPEPSCGAGSAKYYLGDEIWPLMNTFTYGNVGIGTTFAAVITSTSTQYAQLGDTVVEGVGDEDQYGRGSTSQKPPKFNGSAPSNGVCVSYSSSITVLENSRNAIITKNQPIINSIINQTKVLRRLRNTMESQAFALLQGKAYCLAEINRLKNDVSILENTDFKPYEPEIYNPKSKFSNTKIGQD